MLQGGVPAACHVDGKNMPGSYSALVILEVGTSFSGAFYMLPQYHMALDLKQGMPLKPFSSWFFVQKHHETGLIK